MKPINVILDSLGLMTFLMFLAACASPPQPTSDTFIQTISPPTQTPDPCTGWDCTIAGVVYEGEAGSGHEVREAVVKLVHTSYCSPTKGEYEVVTGKDGTFKFEVFLHDTDGFRIEVELDGYEAASHTFGGFDCLYCSCPAIEIVLENIK